MTLSLRVLSIAALLTAAIATPAAFAQDAMAPATDAMAPATDAMAPATDAMAGDAMMSDADLALCLEQAGMITFPSVMQAAVDACNAGHGAMGADAMATDAMATDAMATDAMAPAQ